MTASSRSDAAGFTVMELLMVITIIGITTAMAVFQAQTALPSIHADSGMRVVVAQLNTARALAISERRNIEVDFVGTSVVQLVRHDIPNGTTVLSAIPFEYRVQFMQFSGVPDTPDAFGANGPVDFGNASTIMFTSDGTLIDQSGVPLNGTVFLGIADHVQSARAVTILGATGRIRGYRWNGVQWSER